MISQSTIDACREIGHREQNGMVWMLLGIACGMVERALPGVEPSRSLLEVVATCAYGRPIERAIAEIEAWIEVEDQKRRTRLRRSAVVRK